MSLFGNTVAGITRGLAQMVKDLEAHAKEMGVKEQKHNERARVEHNKAHEAAMEIKKARAVAEKIGDLLK